MEESVLKRLLHTVKDKFKKEPKVDPSMNEYAFSNEDLDELKKDNIEKIRELKKEILDNSIKEEILNESNLNESILNEKTEEQDDFQTSSEVESNSIDKEVPKNSFIHLEEEHQNLIMSKWKSIDLTVIDKDIIMGKDLLNHNYTITYADEAAKFIHGIRKKYEVVICYLIGFNNEKKGIYEKTYFGDSLDNEWKHLNHYIKLLEKIRNFKFHEP